MDENQLDMPLKIDVKGTIGLAVDEMITFHEVRTGRDKGLWQCGMCGVAFYEDWRVKHVNWHHRSRRSRR
jgi:hypothetical protein